MKVCLGLLVAALFWQPVASFAADDLEAVHAVLAPLRGRAGTSAPVPAEVFTARGHLQAWIEARLATFPHDGDAEALSKELNAATAGADLSCLQNKAPGYDRCTSPGTLDARGYLGLVEIGRVGDILIVQAETGIVCGFDEAVSLYQWDDGGWQRLLDGAQRPDAQGSYRPEQIEQVFFERHTDPAQGGWIVAAVGVQPECAPGTFRPVHYRLWHARTNAPPLLLAEEHASANAARRGPIVSVRFEHRDLLVEMDVASIDPDIRSRVAVRQFHFDGQRVQRVAPIALTPRDFVDEWLHLPWSFAASWTAPEARAALADVHAALIATRLRGHFRGVTKRCDGSDDVEVDVLLNSGAMFFRMKESAVGAFEMQAVGSQPTPSCTALAPTLDARRTLFP